MVFVLDRHDSSSVAQKTKLIPMFRSFPGGGGGGQSKFNRARFLLLFFFLKKNDNQE